MDDGSKTATGSRRDFLKATALGGAAAAGLPRGASSQLRANTPGERTAPDDAGAGRLFSSGERSALAALADRVLPRAGEWGAVGYVESVLTIFDHDPPRLYAGPAGSRDEWLPVDRVREHAWRLRIYGSDAVEYPNEAVLGPVRGLRPLLLEGAREAAALQAIGESADATWDALSSKFQDAFTELVLEGTLGDPIYGGNRDGAAWQAFHFEGAMLGYGTFTPGPKLGAHAHHAAGEATGTDASDVDAGSVDEGPDPLGFLTRAALWLMGVFSRRIA